MRRIFKISLGLGLLASLAIVGAARAQTADLSVTDPAQIAAECGGDFNAGKVLFAGCAACHSLTDEADPRLGPHLAQVFARGMGAVEGFAYSPSMRLAHRSGQVWEREALHAWLTGPDGHGAKTGVPLTDPQQGRDLMTYLRTETQAPPPAPEEVVVPAAVWSIEADLEYGAYLASDCVSCHQGASFPISGWSQRAFVQAMYEYRERARPEPAMQLAAQRLSDEEIVALAAYFATLTGPEGS